MKATSASFSYGASHYPVHEDNLPELDEAELRALVAPIVARMSELSGGHRLGEPEIKCAICEAELKSKRPAYEIPAETVVTRDGNVLYAEASDLGLKPGVWPMVIEYEGVPFARVHVEYRAGELAYTEYSSGEMTFEVLND